ncbi:MAG: hypothetical protein RL769_684 [Pseudomonadota bacterium]|jgi:sulfite exporter TauE/SafE
MENFFSLFSTQYYLLISLFSLGFFGSFSHCVGMCGPLVIAQTSSNLAKIKLADYSFMQRLKNSALLPYHLGRITTYSLIALISKFITKSFDETRFFEILSAIFLIIASLFFLKIFLEDFNKSQKLNFLKNFSGKFFKNKPTNKLLLKIFNKTKLSKFINFLFQNPRGWRGFLLGIILGFLPCGLIYGAVLITLNFVNPINSALAMLCFGLSTIPALFFTGFFMSFILKFALLKYLAKLIIFLNILMLLILAFKQI